jgi:hypothetical protein
VPPDAGHNEVLGFLGVGSAMRLTASPALTRAFLAVRDWRLFQLLSRAYSEWRPAPSAPALSADESLMARAMPKSMTFTRPVSVIMMFADLMSR